jgi:class 3 adenylate cyclase
MGRVGLFKRADLVVAELDVEGRHGVRKVVRLRGAHDRRGDVGGIAVHIAARGMATAQPGEILTSSSVRDLVVGSDIASASSPNSPPYRQGSPGFIKALLVVT